jgi:D-lactate dehydrogenase
MRLTLFSAKAYDIASFDHACPSVIELTYIEDALTRDTAIQAQGCDAICAFVNDQLDEPVLLALSQYDVKHILLRCAGFDHVDLQAAKRCGLAVSRVAAYSPHAVAEHAVMLMLALNRRLSTSQKRQQYADFTLDGLVGRDLSSLTVGIYGVGRIGQVTASIVKGFGARVLLSDPVQGSVDMGEWVSPESLLSQSDIVSLHMPMCEANHHLINTDRLSQMKPHALLINTSRGCLVDAPAVIAALNAGQIGGYATDVYEHEAGIFFNLHASVSDPVLAQMIERDDVLLTPHQGFLTREALRDIAQTTLQNAVTFSSGQPLPEDDVVIV